MSRKKATYKMGKIRVVLEFDNPHAPEYLVDIGQLLRDALGEFAANRGSSDYVRMRYEGRSDEWVAEKRLAVERRIAMAEAMLHGTRNIEFDPKSRS